MSGQPTTAPEYWGARAAEYDDLIRRVVPRYERWYVPISSPHASACVPTSRHTCSAEAVAAVGDYARNARLFRSLTEAALAGAPALGAETLTPRA